MRNFTFPFRNVWHLWLILFSVLTSIRSYAQEPIVITGAVISTDGVALPGVSVKYKGSTTGTITDANGRFSLTVPSGGTIVLSFIGFTTKEVQVTQTTTLNITLSDDVQALSEVVVVGYGTARKQDLTGSVAVVGADDFQKGNITSPEQLIAGKVPGVSIISNGGQPGAGSTIRVRGGSSLAASNEPLIVIDGVALDNSSVAGASNPLSFINQNDIESFTVLKDASAAAIYGARAANGVIIITTKKGRSTAFTAEVNSVNSISNIIRKVDVLSADEFRAVLTENGITGFGDASTNWQDEIYQTAFNTDNNVALSGGIKNFPYRLSLGYQDQTGVLKTDKLRKTQLALVLNPRFFNDHLKVDLNLKGSVQKTRFANTSAIGAAVIFDPTQEIFTSSNRFGGYYEYLDPTQPSGLQPLVTRNPVGLLNQTENRSDPKRSIGNVQLDYKFHFLPDLRANLNLGYDITDGAGTTFVADSAASEYLRKGVSNRYKSARKNTIAEFYLNYVKDIKSIKSRIDLTAGYSYNDFLTKFYNYADYNAAREKIPNSDPEFPFDEPHNRLISYFGRANYNYDDRYLLTATLRRDGSSRFGPENQYGSFPSVAMAWTIKNESFLKNVEAISNLKFRLGYGITGQQDGLSNFGYFSFYNLSSTQTSYQFGDTFYQMYRPSAYIPGIKWEETATTNIGLDFGFMNSRILGSIDFYTKITDDLLNRVPQPAGSNFSASAVTNVGSMENRGVEFNLDVHAIEKKDFTLNMGFNITYNKNEITNLTVVPNDPKYLGFPGGTIAGGVGGQSAQINSVGYGKNTFFLYQQVYDQAGKPIEGIFVDQNKDGIINQSDRVKTKAADPNVFLGFTTNMAYKRFNAGFVLRANIGNYVYNNNYSATGTFNHITGSAVLYNPSRHYLETGFAGSDGNQLLSDYYLQNGSFLKMDNLSLGYNVGKLFDSKAALRLSATVQNVFVITNYSGLDPETSSGIDNNLYPRPRTFSLGINLSY